MVNIKKIAVISVLIASIIFNFIQMYFLNAFVDHYKNVITLSKEDWVCAIEYIPNEKPEDKFCVVYAMKLSAIE